MTGALWFLLWRSLRGRLVRKVRRLREPRYLIGFLVGAGWLGFWFSHAFSGGDLPLRLGLPEQVLRELAGPLADGVQLAVCTLIALLLAIWWALPFGKHAIELSEAELHLLLPAPLPRRRLIQYAMLRSQPAVAFGAAIITVVAGVREPLAVARTFAATWLVLSLWDLHGKARSLWLAQLDQLPARAAWRRRLTLWAVVAGVTLLLTLAVAQVAAAALADPSWSTQRLDGETLARLLGRHVATARRGLLGWLLTPLLWLTGPWFAHARPGAGALVGAAVWVPPSLLLLLHHEWVVRSQARFEEAALASARRRSRAADPAARYWRGSARRRRAHPFRLPPGAGAEVAIVWKNLLQVHRWPLAWSGAAIAGVATAALLACAVGLAPPWTARVLLITGAAMLALPPLLTPRSVRCDLRADLLKVEVVRTWPLPAWRFFLAQAASPALLASLQSLAGALLIVAVVGADAVGVLPGGALPAPPAAGIGGTTPLFAAVALTAAALPWSAALALLGSLLENLAALLFPSWVELGLQRKQAAARTGQNMLVFLALSLLMAAALAPAAAVVAAWLAIRLWLWQLPLRAWELVLLAWVALVPVLAVLAALVSFGARAWERLDPSAEILGGRP